MIFDVGQKSEIQMQQLFVIEFYRIAMNFEPLLKDRLINYCDKVIMSNIVKHEIIFELSLIKNMDIIEINEICKNNYDRITDELPSNVTLAFIRRMYNESKMTLDRIKIITNDIYNYIPIMDDNKRLNFLNISYCIESLEYYGTENTIRDEFDNELSFYKEFDEQIPL